MERALTIKEAAPFLRITTTHLYRLVAEGKLPHFKIGSAVRFLPSKLEKFMAGEWTPKAPKRKRGAQIKNYDYMEELLIRGPSLH